MGNSEYGRLRRVAVRSPAEAFLSQEVLRSTWKNLNYLGEPNFGSAVAEFEALIEVLLARNIVVEFLGGHPELTPDAIFVRDPTAMVDGNAIACSMQKPNRWREPEINSAQLRELGIPQIGQVLAPDRLESGDIVWLDDLTAVVGQSRRTNAAGVQVLREHLGILGKRLILTHVKAYGDLRITVHLSTVFNSIGFRKAIVFRQLLTDEFCRLLNENEYTLFEVNEDEFLGQAVTSLAVDDGVVLIESQSEKLIRALMKAGLDVVPLQGKNLCILPQGGYSCLSRPLSRDAVALNVLKQ